LRAHRPQDELLHLGWGAGVRGGLKLLGLAEGF